jgi:hypothetical protein
MTIDDLLAAHGYRLAEDAWISQGRMTYVHDDDADQRYLADLTKTLGSDGWTKSHDKLRTFSKDGGRHEIEIEPGGSGVDGHFLHHMKVG